jgi:pimeloyl-ACP methyl ester carboxylesterase
MTSGGNIAGVDAVRLVDIGNKALETTVTSRGEPVVLVHGSAIADAFAPLLHEPLIAERFQLISYHRRGYACSTRSGQPLSMSEQATDCRALIDALGIERAHVVGHSLGGVTALQLALETPKKVHSLVLLEAAIMDVPSVELLMAGLAPVISLYQAGQKVEAVDAFERGVIGPDYRPVLDERVPGAFAQAVADADTLFAQELPMLQLWRFSREDAMRIGQPALVVMGADNPSFWPGFKEGYERLREWLPRTEGFVLPAATHGQQMQNPRGVAETVAGFLARHPLPIAA